MDENYDFLREQIELTDEQLAALLEDYREGGEKSNGAFVTILQSQGLWIIKCINNLDLPPGTSPDDILSEVMIALMTDLKKYDSQKSRLSTFIAMVIYHRAKKVMAANSPQSNGSPVDIGQYIVLSHEQTLEERDWFNSLCMDVLDDQERYIIQLRSKGFDFGQIARRLGVKPSWASRRFHKAVGKLREGVGSGVESTEC